MPLGKASGNVIRFWVAEANAKQRNAHIKSGCTVNGHQRHQKTRLSDGIFSIVENNNYDTGFVAIAMRMMHEISAMQTKFHFSAASFGNASVPHFFSFKIAHLNCYLLEGMSTQLDIQANAEDSTSSHRFEKEMDWKECESIQLQMQHSPSIGNAFEWKCSSKDLRHRTCKQSYQRQRCCIQMNICLSVSRPSPRSDVATYSRRVSILFYDMTVFCFCTKVHFVCVRNRRRTRIKAGGGTNGSISILNRKPNETLNAIRCLCRCLHTQHFELFSRI